MTRDSPASEKKYKQNLNKIRKRHHQSDSEQTTRDVRKEKPST
jgi:hypothetical protein